MSFIALVDCNNFFVSCERVFNPKLIGRPAVVLSCNDGCIIARSQEVKDLGIPMGAPYFQWASFLKAHEVAIFSSNFALYGDLSHRVMETLRFFNPDLEVYSIDEAFLHIEGVKDVLAHCRHIRQKVLQWTGIPVSIGIAKTKTLAKVANRRAKKNPSCQEVCHPSEQEVDVILKKLDVGDIWGIGSRLSHSLAKRGIFTAAQLRDQPDHWIKSTMSVVGLRTVMELRGIPCLNVEEVTSAKQTIMTSRSFGRPILSHEELLEAISSFTARGAEKLREEGSLASWLQIFIETKRHLEDAYYSNQARAVLAEPTNFTPHLLNCAKESLKAIFRPGFVYKRAGILLGGLVPEGCYQQDLFTLHDPVKEAKRKTVMNLLDKVNNKYGYRALQFASEGISQGWQRKKGLCSDCYTTRWSDLLTIRI